ncbi:homocysteine-responsive endoplasmic reticulum-resident ubiquitin-like domain member 2 protein [Daktulosphaira vitifoliae]|uniref:homocysteine-responsive endoplasmic reticulum-resident ubiquitin-like domain member 2 protein n=1 Tax=Daktulosphaira vitifoliae TaxID=58002 RepID=UPI0021A99B66|nr:homocysteine-responsive endoplasmic reticulum-resident ubiquitin-like domain member 2 protein [Daktulosphaira vitifoliae]
MEASLSDSWITLTIKAPNQQIDDQVVKCQLNWSVAKLKDHIHEIYPNKPKIEDQRLIYSGQLLNDSITLKDILRPYDDDGQLNRTIHLVCASSSFSAPLKKDTSKIENISHDDIRQSNVKFMETNNIHTCETSRPVNYETINSNNMHEFSSPIDQNRLSSYNNPILLSPEQIASEQIVWINRMYAIQMAQYWQYVAARFDIPHQNITQMTVNNELPINNNNNNNVIGNNQQEVQNIVPGENVNEPNIPNNQDWLDWLYVSSRIFIFLSVIYFYSSPGRFIVVAGFAVFFYLYQTGLLRQIHEQNRRRAIPENQEQVVDNNRNITNGNTEDTTSRQNERLMTTLWTVISTFFTSLIPQAPDII